MITAKNSAYHTAQRAGIFHVPTVSQMAIPRSRRISTTSKRAVNATTTPKSCISMLMPLDTMPRRVPSVRVAGTKSVNMAPHMASPASSPSARKNSSPTTMITSVRAIWNAR